MCHNLLSILRLFFESHVFSNDNNLVSKSIYYHSCENNSNNNIPYILNCHHLTMTNSLVNIVETYPTFDNLAIAQFGLSIYLWQTIYDYTNMYATTIQSSKLKLIIYTYFIYSLLPLFLWQNVLSCNYFVKFVSLE